MAMKESTMSMKEGSIMPSFQLLSVSGAEVSSQEFQGSQGVFVTFICNHCPFVVHLREALVKVCAQLQEQGLATLAINSNDATQYPEDSYMRMRDYARDYKYSFDYLYDENQEVARSFDAACTPDFYLFDKDAKLFYKGQFDDSRPGKSQTPDGSDLMRAANLMLAGQILDFSPKPSIGCSIKWK